MRCDLPQSAHTALAKKHTVTTSNTNTTPLELLEDSVNVHFALDEVLLAKKDIT